jgi:serine/threonine-protein kinase
MLRAVKHRLPPFILLKQRGRAANSAFASTAAEAPTVSDSPVAAEAPNKPLDALPTVGQIGRYALKYRIGEGGLGAVYAALDPLLSRPVAVKMLDVRVEPSERATLDGLFLQEARAAARLNHPHIVTVHDAGIDRRGLYIAMERLKGADLRQLLHDGWRPTPAQAATLVRRVADALAYAHDRGVVHCDIKPANIFMVGRSVPKVLDFGIARITRGPKGSAQSGLIAGSPAYMAPEQLRGEAVDGRADVYALGTVLYELLSGHRAHSTPGAEAEPLQSLPAGLVAIVQRAMMKKPTERFDSARQLSQALRLWQRQQRLRAAPVSHRAAPWTAAAAALVLFGAIIVASAVWRPRWPAPHRPEPTARALPATEPLAITTAATTAASEPAPERVVEVVAASLETPTPPAPQRAMSAAPKAPAAQLRKPVPRSNGVPAAALQNGVLQIAVSPWGDIEIDGAPAGTAPPLNELHISEGSHTVTIRNADYPAFSASVRISADHPVVLRHRFGS